MILSICLAAFLPFMAYSWHHHGEHPVFSDLPVDSAPPQPTPPPPPSCHSFPSQRQRAPKLGNIWMKGKVKKTVVHSSTSVPIPTVNEAAYWVNTNHQERRLVGLQQDYFLEEQVHVPSGAHLTWYKNNRRLLRQGDSASNSGSAPSSSQSSSSSSSAFLRISSAVYIDCTSVDDAGFYRLEVELPNGDQNLHRNYTVIVVDWSGIPGGSCQYGRNVMAYVPRIYQYASYVAANEGDTVVLPCGYQGLLTSFDWHRNNSLVLPQVANHEKRPNGDLVIQQLGGGPVRYACRVGSTEYDIDDDVTVTDVYIQETSNGNNNL